MRNTASTAACTLSWPWRGAILITYRVADDATRYFSRQNIYRARPTSWYCDTSLGRTRRNGERPNRERDIKNARALLPLITERDGSKTYVVYVTMKRYVISDRVRARKRRRGRNSAREQTLPWTWRRRQIADCCISEPETPSRTSTCEHNLRFSACFIQRLELTYRNVTRFALSRHPASSQLPNANARRRVNSSRSALRKRSLIKTRLCKYHGVCSFWQKWFLNEGA